ncbi:hypothetical protein GUJ93_ZPchr0001g31334 [Zizania palustris]|uniref:RING-type domain-containing protein n=1 Tax=Zizania palustris TaxID=103762 RepID=A0A8J5RD90_ZIZPA|nr:hypothetical protein GUJ93_ZPchr0001g31334 [Zizania palustris]
MLSSATLPMAQLDACSDRAADDGHIHVIDMPQLVDASHGSCHVLDRAGPPDTSGRSHVVIDIDAGDGGSSTTGTDDAPCCAVCMEPLEWVAVGPCGHRVVCPECAARIRSAPRRSKLCCICRALCPSVVVTKAASGGEITFSTLPAASSQDGRVGKYWYFAAMSAYFDDEQQYKAAKAVAATIAHLKPPPPPTTAQTASTPAAVKTSSTRSRSRSISSSARCLARSTASCLPP